MVIINMGTDAAPNYQEVAAQTGFTTGSSRPPLDGSVKGNRHAQSTYGRMETTGSLEALVSFADGTQQQLEDVMKNEKEIVLRHRIEAAATGDEDKILEAPAIVTTINRSYTDSANAGFSAEFSINGFWTEAAPTP